MVWRTWLSIVHSGVMLHVVGERGVAVAATATASSTATRRRLVTMAACASSTVVVSETMRCALGSATAGCACPVPARTTTIAVLAVTLACGRCQRHAQTPHVLMPVRVVVCRVALSVG